jgi:hypothetical protein
VNVREISLLSRSGTTTTILGNISIEINKMALPDLFLK